MIKRLTVLIFLAVVIFGCSKAPAVSSFAGNWSGNYTGTCDSGTFTFSIDNNGKATGKAKSVMFDTTFTGTGNVSTSGSIVITIGTISSGASFTGTLKESAATGTWLNNMNGNNYTGNWNGNKQ